MNRRWKPEIFPADDSGAGEGGGGAPTADDIAALKKTLNSERALREKAEKAVNARKEADELATKTLTEQVAALTAKLAEAQAQLEATTADYEGKLSQTKTTYKFAAALQAAGVLPEYADRFNDVAAQLSLDRDQLMADGKPFDPKELRAKYPAMFAAAPEGAGSGATGGTAPPASAGEVRVVKASDRAAMSAVDPLDLISGKVVIE
jgi:hypothetical protein